MNPTMAEPINIQTLTRGEVLNLAGHERGLAARALFGVDALDADAEPVEVMFPTNFRQVSSSFFQGMFATSVHRFGSIEGFFEHYRFNAPSHVRAKLVDYAEQVLAR
jgi:hypothetical protein